MVTRRSFLRSMLAAPLIIPAARLEFGVPRQLWQFDIRRQVFTNGAATVTMAEMLGFGLAPRKLEGAPIRYSAFSEHLG